MAKTAGVWGIDVGNCALKALHCYVNREDGTVVADAFDYIEYPNILTEPDIEPGDLVHDALQQFLSRNNIKGEKIAISVAGKNGITRFIKLPPVDEKRIPDLIKYEAKQVIPFDLKEVILDYQRLGGDKNDMALEVDIGLFAMKRDIAYQLLEPFDDVHIPVDFVQLTPISLYNMAMHEYMTNLPSPDEYDPENPPPFVGFLSIGTDNSDLVLTNGFKIWVRDIPIGGSHFTKALTTEMKLTFAKAEHLKRNASQSTDKKALFQSMRTVFSNYVDEIQRSIRYFISLDRYATIDKIIGFGNAIQLAGLRKYLEQNLGITVEVAESFNNVNMTEIKNNPSFTDNFRTFAVCYGLCLQGLGMANLGTNFLPREIVHARIINSKKPWMAAAAALMLLGATISFGSHVSHNQSSKVEDFNRYVSQAKSIVSEVSSFQSQKEEEDKKFNDNKVIGDDLLANSGRSVEWLELMKIIDAALPSDPPDVNVQDIPIQKRNQVQIDNIEAQPFGKVELWKEYVTKAKYYKVNAAQQPAGDEQSGEGAGMEEGTAEASSESSGDSSESAVPKTWLVQITGYHYHNKLPEDKTVAPEAASFVRERIIKNLQDGRIKLALPPTFALWVDQQTAKMQSEQAGEDAGSEGDGDSAPTASATKKYVPYKAEGDDKEGVWYTMKEMGISYPVLIEAPGVCGMNEVVVPLYEERTGESEVSKDADISRGMADVPAGPSGGVESNKSKTVKLCKYTFIIQFLWTPTDPLQREINRQETLRKQEEERIAKEKAEQEAAQQAEEDASSN